MLVVVEFVVVVLEFVWSVVEGDVDGVEGEVDGLVVEGCWLGWLDWSGVEPELPVCANAIPVVSISAKINFLFMSLLLRYLRPSGLDASLFPPTSTEVKDADTG